MDNKNLVSGFAKQIENIANYLLYGYDKSSFVEILSIEEVNYLNQLLEQARVLEIVTILSSIFSTNDKLNLINQLRDSFIVGYNIIIYQQLSVLIKSLGSYKNMTKERVSYLIDKGFIKFLFEVMNAYNKDKNITELIRNYENLFRISYRYNYDNYDSIQTTHTQKEEILNIFTQWETSVFALIIEGHWKQVYQNWGQENDCKGDMCLVSTQKISDTAFMLETKTGIKANLEYNKETKKFNGTGVDISNRTK